MDINEKKGKKFNRHPWELSRTKCFLDEISYYIKEDKNKTNEYLNVGAGDMYFDRVLLKKFPEYVSNVIDIGYKSLESSSPNIKKYNKIEELKGEDYDYAIMMDSLEYMIDDVEYIKNLSEKIKNGGYIFLTLPAFHFLQSDHDLNVGNLRRYSMKNVKRIEHLCQGTVKIEKMHFFFTSLFLVRVIEKVLNIPIDPKKKVTTGWKYKKSSMITKIVCLVLNVDYYIGKITKGIIPGLSMMVVLKKVEG